MGKLVIFGTGDIGRLAHHYFTRDSQEEVVAFTVDREYVTAETYLDLPLVPFDEITSRYPPATHRLFVAMSYSKMNQLRASRYEQARSLGYTLASYVSSRCSWLTDHPVGDNCFILEDNTVQPFVRIGNNVTLWSGNHIGHDSIIEDHCFVSSHVVVSGHVRIGPYCFLGVNSTLRNGIVLARETLVGAGAVIMKNTVEKGVYLPQRAERFPKNSDEIQL